jgi:hypothetical protein
VVASDLSASAVRRLRARSPARETIELDIGAPLGPFSERRFDAVSAFDVLFHIADDEAYRRAHRNLASLVVAGGLLVISENLCQPGRGPASEYQVNRSESEILGELDANGLEVIARRRMFSLMNGPINSTSRLHRAWWKRTSEELIRHPRLGGPIGAAAYPLEIAMISRRAPAPSTELLVCRKPANQAAAGSR